MAAAAETEMYSTYKSFLMHGTGTGTLTWSKLLDVKDYPNLGGEPDLIDMTTLSNKMKIGIPGIQNSDAMTFTANYNPTVYARIKEMADGTAKHFAVWFGGTVSGSTLTPDGSDGKFTFDGVIDIYVSGKGVNEGREMVVTITPTTDIDFDVPT